MSPDVAILIPAYRAEAFIDRTLEAARAQTHAAIDILVSVDDGGDATTGIVARHAEDDPRVRLFAQGTRLGWAANVNFLLDRATTPFCCLYFHDDLIEPVYVETLRAALLARPDAVSAHCDMDHFGGGDHLTPARPYEGDAVTRLLTFLLAPNRGAPLRSLMRTGAVRHVRLPEGARVWENEPFLMDLVAAGPALAVHRALYHRWEQRAGGLTDGWKGLSPQEVARGHRQNLVQAVEIIDRIAGEPEARRALLTGLYLYILPRMRSLETQAGERLFSRPSDLHPALEGAGTPPDVAGFGAEIEAWAADRWTPARRDLQRRAAAEAKA